MKRTVHRSNPLKGIFPVPGDKSISHRALLFSALADGKSEVTNLLESLDVLSTIQCLKDLGVTIDRKQSNATIRGNGVHGFTRPDRMLDAGNSGTTIRLLSGLLAGQPFVSEISGDRSLQQRPMNRVIEPLSRMGAQFRAREGGFPPVRISGKNPLSPLEYHLPIASAQVKSAVLLAGMSADGTTSITESKPSRDHTERMLGLPIEQTANGKKVSLKGGDRIEPRTWSVPGDISSSMFLLGAALLIEGSHVIIQGVGLNPTRRKALELLQSVGADIQAQEEQVVGGEPIGTIECRFSELSGRVSVDDQMVPLVIDEIPLLAVLLAAKQCSFEIRGAGELRHKESDRISLLTRNLRAMGVDVSEENDGIAFESKNALIPAAITTLGDHRMAMAFAVAGMSIGDTIIEDPESAAVSFPGFWDVLQQHQA